MRRFQVAEMKQRGAERPVADHLQVRIAEPLEQLQHLERDVARRGDFAGDDVVRGQADQDGDDAGRILHLAAERRARARRPLRPRGSRSRGRSSAPGHRSSADRARRRPARGCPARCASRSSPRRASRAVSSWAYSRAAACAARFQKCAARIVVARGLEQHRQRRRAIRETSSPSRCTSRSRDGPAQAPPAGSRAAPRRTRRDTAGARSDTAV